MTNEPIAASKRTYKIGVDVDGVLADFSTSMVDVLKYVGCPVEFPVKDPSFPPVWDWFTHYGVSAEHLERAWDLIKQDPTFWVRLAPLANTKEDIKTLAQVFNYGHEIYFITTRPGLMSKFQTESWLAVRGMLVPTVLIARTPNHKGLIADGLDLDMLIDDRPDNLEALPKRTQPFLYAAPYNKTWREENPGKAWTVSSVTEMIEIMDKTGNVEIVQ